MSSAKSQRESGKVHDEVNFEIEYIKYKSNIWKLYLYSFFISFYTVTGVFLAFFLKWGKISFFEVMLLQSYFSLMFFIFEIPAGAFADFIGRKYALTLAATTLAFAGLLYSLIPNIIMFFIAETLWAFGEALLSGTTEAFIFSNLRSVGQEQRFSKIKARCDSILLIGLLISIPLGIFIAQVISLEFTMTFVFFPYLAAGFISLLFKEPRIAKKRKISRYLLELKKGILKLKKNKILRILSIDMVLVQSLVILLYYMYQIFLEELNIQLYFFGFIYALMILTQVAFLNLVPQFLKWFKKKMKYLKISTLITGIAFIFLGFTTNIPFILFLIILIAGFGFTRYIIFAKAINKHIQPESRALVLSSINMIGSLAQAILFALIGVVIGFEITIGFIVIGLIIILLTIFSRVKNEYL